MSRHMEPHINTSRGFSRGYVNVSEAAHWFGLSDTTIRNYIRDGILPSKRIGHRVLIPITALAVDSPLVQDPPPKADR